MNFDDRIKNRSFTTNSAVGLLDRHGADVLVVVSKLALRFELAGRMTLDIRPLRAESEPDESGGIRYPGDLAVEKPGFDFGLVGVTRAFGDRATEREAWLSVGLVKKRIRLWGPRVFKRGIRGVHPGSAAPIEEIPLRFDRCFGGTDKLNAAVYDPLNPIGRGHGRDPESLVGTAAPEIELLPNDSGLPSCSQHAAFAPISHNWSPRREYAGTYDNTWSRRRAPIFPLDFDPRYYAWAPRDQHLPSPPRGSMHVEIGGLVPMKAGSPIRLRLPPFDVFHAVAIRGNEAHVQAVCDSLLVDLDHYAVELVYRSSHRLPMKWEHLETIEVTCSGLPDELLTPDHLHLASEGRAGESLYG